ncbi:MAG: hypothetical protein ACYTBS_18665, partial [Planctomycetota bacterium]
MVTVPRHKVFASVVCVVVVALAAVAGPGSLLSTSQATGQSSGHHSFLGGPWELVIKMGMEGQALRFPIAAHDESKPQKFDDIVAVMGTP